VFDHRKTLCYPGCIGFDKGILATIECENIALQRLVNKNAAMRGITSSPPHYCEMKQGENLGGMPFYFIAILRYKGRNNQSRVAE
jgi:hypothetical protein